MTMKPGLLALALFGLVAACVDDPPPVRQDAAVDARRDTSAPPDTRDAPAPDAPAPDAPGADRPDAATPVDGSAPDLPSADGAAPDAITVDGATPDAQAPDVVAS